MHITITMVCITPFQICTLSVARVHVSIQDHIRFSNKRQSMWSSLLITFIVKQYLIAWELLFYEMQSFASLAPMLPAANIAGKWGWRSGKAKQSCILSGERACVSSGWKICLWFSEQVKERTCSWDFWKRISGEAGRTRASVHAWPLLLICLNEKIIPSLSCAALSHWVSQSSGFFNH